MGSAAGFFLPGRHPDRGFAPGSSAGLASRSFWHRGRRVRRSVNASVFSCPGTNSSDAGTKPGGKERKCLFMKMKNLLIVTSAFIIVGCGGGGGGGSDNLSDASGDGSSTAPPDAGPPTSSEPLKDNSDAPSYKVLLMGNSHAAGLRSVLENILASSQPDKSVDVQTVPGVAFLDERRNDGVSEEKLKSEPWTHVVLQAQKYSTTGSSSYPTTAAEFWIRLSKQLGATPIMFPEHPRRGNRLEGRTLFELHSGIATRENACVAPVSLVWDEVIFRDPSLTLHQADGNHASRTGIVLTALVFYQIITGQPVESVPELSEFGIDPETEQLMKEAVSSLLFTYPACAFEG